MNSFESILKQWQSYSITTTEDLDFYLDNFRILFAYNSNHIENPNTTYHDTREIFEHGSVSSYTGDLRTIFEIQNQKDCYEFLKEKIAAKEPLSQELIKNTHQILMHGCYDQSKYNKGERPGEYKKHLFVVGDDIGAAPDEVEDEIAFVLKEVLDNEGKDPLTVAAYLHLSFESIHPFADGNGRLGRTLMNYYLITHNYPPVIIYSEDKETYYLALAVFDKAGEIDGFKKFIQEQAIKTWSHRANKRIPFDNNNYYLEVTKNEAEQLKANGIQFKGEINNKTRSIICVKKSDKKKADSILAQMRNHKGLKK